MSLKARSCKSCGKQYNGNPQNIRTQIICLYTIVSTALPQPLCFGIYQIRLQYRNDITLNNDEYSKPQNNERRELVSYFKITHKSFVKMSNPQNTYCLSQNR